MEVMVVEPEKAPYLERIWNDLETLRKKLGDVELEILEYQDILIIYNARGLAENVPINRCFNGIEIRGTFLIAKNNMKEMDLEGLTDEQIDKYMQEFSLDNGEELEL